MKRRPATVPDTPAGSQMQRWCRTAGALLAALLVAILAASGAGGAVAQSAGGAPRPASLPADALKWNDPAVAAAWREVERLESEVARPGRLDYSARLRPSARYRDYPEDGAVGDLSARFGLSAQLLFGQRGPQHVRSLQSVERARQRALRLDLRSTRDALLAHAELLLEQEQEMAAGSALASAAAAVSALLREDGTGEDGTGEAGTGEAGIDEAVRRRAALDIELAELAHDREKHHLAEARARAAAFGLRAAATYEPLRFTLPESNDLEDLTSRRLLELDLLEAEAELASARARPLDDLRIGASYRNRGLDLGIEGGVVNGRSGMSIGLDVPGGPERWELQISAEVVLDDGWRRLPLLEEAVAAARTTLSGFAVEQQRAMGSSVTAARLAERALDLAEEDLELLEVVLETRRAEFEALGGNGDEAAARSVQRAVQAVERAERDVSRARVRMYRAWIAYVRAVATVLETAEGSWAVRPR